MNQEINSTIGALEKFAGEFGETLPKDIIEKLKEAEESTESIYSKKERIQAFKQLINCQKQLLGIRRSLRTLIIPEQEKELSMMRFSLLKELELSNLLRNPSIAQAIIKNYTNFTAFYQKKYKQYHQKREEEKANFFALWEELVATNDIISKLNRISCLGEPVGLEEQKLVDNLGRIFSRCSELNISPDSLVCENCGAKLGEKVPVDALKEVHKTLTRLLKHRLQALSRILISKVVDERGNQKLQALIDSVTLSNLSDIAELLDDNLIGLIDDITS